MKKKITIHLTKEEQEQMKSCMKFWSEDNEEQFFRDLLRWDWEELVQSEADMGEEG